MPATPAAATPHTNTDVQPATPTEEMSANGVARNRGSGLPTSLVDRIREAATKQMPANEVAPTTTAPAPTPAPSNEPAAKPSTPSTPAPAQTVAAPKDAAPAVKPAGGQEGKAADADGKSKKDGIAQVREALERAEAAKRELEASHTATVKEKVDAYAKAAELEAKVRSWEERYAKELEPQLKQLTEKEKRLQEAEERLRVRDYTATPQFHDTYVKPIVETQQEALQFVGELVATMEDGKQVPATQEHLNYVIGAPNANEAARRAEALFGSTFTGTLVNYRTRLRALAGKREEAVKRASVESEAYFKQQQEAHAANEARFRQDVEKRVQTYLVKPAEQDPEEQAAWQEGQKLAERIANGVQDPEQRADLAARIMAYAPNDRIKDVRLKRLSDELAATKAQLAAYQRNEPDVSTSGKGAPAVEQGGALAPSPLHQHLMERARAAARGRM